MTSETSQVEEAGLLTVFTFVLWITCLAVAATGLLLQTTHPTVPATHPAVDQVTTMDVDVTKEASPIADTGPPPPNLPPPPEAASPMPPAPAVALASPAIAFALPMDGPVRIVAAEKAAPVHAVLSQTPSIIRLTPGQGEGYRPMPEYPIEARLAHEQGSLVVTLTVGEDGRVTSAHVSTPSWPSLNQTSLRTVREEWRFPPGPVRTYEAPFEFKLTDQQ